MRSPQSDMRDSGEKIRGEEVRGLFVGSERESDGWTFMCLPQSTRSKFGNLISRRQNPDFLNTPVQRIDRRIAQRNRRAQIITKASLSRI